MTRWEYHWVRVPLYGEGQYNLDTLDELGADGWEAYARSPTRDDHMVVHLKRPMPKESTDK